MATDSLFNHLAQEATLLSFDSEHDLFSIRIGSAAPIAPAMIDTFEALGFSRDCSCRWTRATEPDALPEIIAAVRPIVGQQGVWDAGKVFGTERDWSMVEIPEAPEAWDGPTAVRVCETGHAVLSSGNEPEQALRDACRAIHQRYLLREFHPSE